jgi:hypothetical protein
LALEQPSPNEALDVVGNISVAGNLTVDTNTLVVDSVNDRVGIGTTTPTSTLHVVNTAVETSNMVSISGNATSGTLLKVAGTATSGGSLFTASNSSGGSFRIAETGAIFHNQSVALNRSGGAIISLGGINNSNTINSGNSGNHTATDFVFRGGIADRTAGNLFQVRNFNIPVLTISASTGAGNVGIGTTSPSARLHTISTTEQVRFGYDVSNYWNATTSSTGVTTLSAEGSGAKFVFANDVEFGANATIPDVIGNTSFADDVEVLGDVVFNSTNRPTSNATGTPTSTNLITLDDAIFQTASLNKLVINHSRNVNSVSGAAQVNNELGALQLFTHSTASSKAQAYQCLGTQLFGYSRLSFARRMIVRTRAIGGMRSGLQYYFQIGRTRASTTASQLNKKGFGYGALGSTGIVTPFVHDGSSITNGATFNYFTYPTIIFDFQPAVALYVYGRDTSGVLSLLSTITTGLPSGSSTYNDSQIEFLKYDLGSGGLSDWTYVSETEITVI